MKTITVKTFCDQLQESMKAKLEAVAREDKEFMTWVTKSQAIVKSYITELRVFVSQYSFVSKAEEIEFFKETKPIITSQYYYYDKILVLKMNEPSGELAATKDYYYNVLNEMQEYLFDHKEFYAYCMSGSTHLDELYFTNRSGTFLGLEIDTRFSTGYDGTLAIFLANQLIREHIEGIIKNLDSDAGSNALKWTTKKAYLVELIYALHGVEAINNGKAEIKQIARLFENLFNIRLGNFYRQFTEIGIRKTGRTNFIDQLKEKLEKRLDDLM